MMEQLTNGEILTEEGNGRVSSSRSQNFVPPTPERLNSLDFSFRAYRRRLLFPPRLGIYPAAHFARY